MKATGVILLLIVVLAMAHVATHKPAGPAHHPAGHLTAVGPIAVRRDDSTMHFTATCDQHGAVLTLHPDTPTTRPAATQSCHRAAHDAAALRSVAASGG